ncbi:hypothetical protein JB92DRAFT_3094165 [Gautieria morchelliformis]|nr:hypothetical protein JB92DRAFT_3094165 [Gautieria morchelliformis]
MPPDPIFEQGCYNLRLYLRQATLPAMECTRYCPHLNNPEVYNSTTNLFKLTPKPESTRKLRMILHLLPAVIDKKIASFMMKIPDKPIPGAHDTAYHRPTSLCMPASSFAIEFNPPKGISDVITMTSWVNRPVLTAERVLDIVWPEATKGYSMMIQQMEPEFRRSREAELYRLYSYKQCRGVDQNDIQEPVCKMVIAQLIPWAFTPKNMDDFLRVKGLPAFSAKTPVDTENPPRYDRAEKIWAKLWDDCSLKKCPYFVLTVYDYWIFGVFVKGWTTAVVSDAIKRTDEKPSVLQWLVFWLASSMKIEGSWQPPLLARFGNPDIRHMSKVALKNSSEERVMTVAQEEWLDTHHKVTQDLRTTEMPGLENTWLTKFDQ